MTGQLVDPKADSALAMICAAVLLVVIPWVNPMAVGPAPGVLPLVVTAACSAMLIFLYPWAAPLWSRERFAVALAWAWVVAASVSAVMGLVQYFGHSGALQPWVSQAEPGMAYANLRQRNQLGTLVVMGLASLLFLVRDARVNATVATVLMTPPLAALAATSSRTGLAQLVVLVGLALLWRMRRGLAVAMLPVYVVLAVALPWLLTLGGHHTESTFARLAPPTESLACHSRLTLWSNVLHLIAQHPWKGWGWGELDYAHFMTLYDGPRFCEILDNAHNLPLHLAVELGVPAAVLVCGLLAWLVWRAKPLAEAAPHRQLAWTVLAVIGVHSLLEYPLWYGPFQMAAVLCVVVLWKPQKPDTVDREQPVPAAVMLGAAFGVAGFALAFYVAWDYHRVSQLYLAQPARDAAYRIDTYDKVRDSKLFSKQVEFAELTTTPVTPANATHAHDTALHLLHFSPEPRVIEKLVESAKLLGRQDEVDAYSARYQAAFKDNFEAWSATGD